MRHARARYTAFAFLGLLLFWLVACKGQAFSGRPDTDGGQFSAAGEGKVPSAGGDAGGAADTTPAVGVAGEAGEDSGVQTGGTGGTPVTGGTGGTGGAGGTAGTSGQPAQCKGDPDCPPASSTCSSISCVDGACLEAPNAEHSACAGGACDAAGKCNISTCDSKKRDGDETGVDCGGSCELCANGEGCAMGSDCISGVCTNQKCQASGCTDTVKNGTESDVDCGGTCSVKCALNKACAVAADCAVPAGDAAQSVRCLQQVCTSTKPPALGIRYWQDFDPARLVKDTVQCAANDDWCLHGNGATYPMFGVAATGAIKGLTKTLLFTAEGVVGYGGKFDGSYCLTRAGTNLSFNDASAFSAMAWVKSTPTMAPWEAAVIGGLNHYFIAVDTNPVSRRFVAALATSQSPSFAYTSAVATGQIPSGEWHHIAEVYDTAAGSMLEYVDGSKVQSKPQAGTVTSGAVDAYLGCRKDVTLGQFFIGTLDEVVLYTRALSAAELADYVRRSKPGG